MRQVAHKTKIFSALRKKTRAALNRAGVAPKIFNTDQLSEPTPEVWTKMLESPEMRTRLGNRAPR